MLLVEGKRLDDPQRPWVIAEISGNHAQDFPTACALVQAAADARADACKFQTFEASDICADVPILFGHDPVHDAWCQRLGVTRMPELFAKGGLPRAWHAPLKALAEDLGLSFLSTPFSLDTARFLVEEVGVRALKIASGDLTFDALLAYADSTDLPLIVSTGAATMAECRAAVDGPLVHAWIDERLVLLHCVSSYPATPAMMNLRCIATLQEALDVPAGLSDHTLDTQRIPSAACALGASVFEKHLRLAGDSTSIDANHALDPTEFAAYVETIRETCLALGDGVKRPQPSEAHDRIWARRGSDSLRPTAEARAGRWA